LCKLTQFIKHSMPLLIGKFRQFLDDFRCAHSESVVSVIRFVRERKFAIARTRSPARETRALPGTSPHFDFDRQPRKRFAHAAKGWARRQKQKKG
jgi:hypothetical protein